MTGLNMDEFNKKLELITEWNEFYYDKQKLMSFITTFSNEISQLENIHGNILTEFIQDVNEVKGNIILDDLNTKVIQIIPNYESDNLLRAETGNLSINNQLTNSVTLVRFYINNFISLLSNFEKEMKSWRSVHTDANELIQNAIKKS